MVSALLGALKAAVTAVSVRIAITPTEQSSVTGSMGTDGVARRKVRPLLAALISAMTPVMLQHTSRGVRRIRWKALSNSVRIKRIVPKMTVARRKRSRMPPCLGAASIRAARTTERIQTVTCRLCSLVRRGFWRYARRAWLPVVRSLQLITVVSDVLADGELPPLTATLLTTLAGAV